MKNIDQNSLLGKSLFTVGMIVWIIPVIALDFCGIVLIQRLLGSMDMDIGVLIGNIFLAIGYICATVSYLWLSRGILKAMYFPTHS